MALTSAEKINGKAINVNKLMNNRPIQRIEIICSGNQIPAVIPKRIIYSVFKRGRAADYVAHGLLTM